jgi:ribosome maturation factor RimP
MDLEATLTPVLERDGLELVEITMGREGGSRVLRVTVDRADGGLDLDTIAAASEKISRRLDLEGFDPGPGSYRLEVSSPGIERPLHTPEQFRRHVGSLVKVKTASPGVGAATHRGTIASADARTVELATDEGPVRIAYEDIGSARTVFDWAAEQKRSNR